MERLYRLTIAFGLPVLLGFCIVWKGGKSLEATWLLTGAAWLLTLAHYRLRGKGQGAPRGLWIAALLFVLWTVASYAQSSVGNYGLDEVLRDGSYFLILFWIAREAREASSRIAPRLMAVMGWGAALACAVGIAVYALQPVNRFVGTFFDWRFQTDYWPNAWGDFALLTWPLLLWMAVIDRKTGAIRAAKSLALRIAGIGMFLGCFFLSYSRGSFLAFIGQLGLLALLTAAFVAAPLLKQSRRPGKLLRWLFPPLKTKGIAGRTIGGIALTLLLAGGTFMAVNAARSAFFPVQSVVEKATFTAAEGSSSIDERAQFWRQAYALSLEKPVFGWGPYAFRFVQPRLQEGVFATSDHPHNIVLKAALERGWPAAFLHALLMLLIAWTGIAYLWKSRGALMKSESAFLGNLPRWNYALLMAALLTGMIGTLAHSMIDYNLQFVANGLLFWIEAGFIVALGYKAARTNTKAEAMAEIALACALMIVAVLEGRYLVTSSIGRHAEAGGNAPKALAWYELSRDEWFSRDMHLSRAHLLLDEGMPDEALRALADYFAVNEEDARAWLLKAEAFETKQDWQSALSAYQQALRLGKYNYADAILGTLEMSQKTGIDISSQLPWFEQLLSDYHEAILHNVHFIALTPNVESFAEAMDRMSALDPANTAKYRTMKEEAVKHAGEERDRLSARTPGLLW